MKAVARTSRTRSGKSRTSHHEQRTNDEPHHLHPASQIFYLCTTYVVLTLSTFTMANAAIASGNGTTHRPRTTMSLVSCVAQKDLQEPQVLSCGGLMPAGQCAANDGRDTSTNQEKDSCSLQMHDRDAGVSQTISRLVPLSHVGDDKCGGVDLINGSLVGKKDTPGCDNDEHDVTGDHCQELSNSNHSGTIGTSESNNRARNNNISKGIEGLDVKGLFAASRTDQFSHVPTGASKPSHSPSGVAPSGLDLLLLAVTASPIPKMNNSDGSQGGADASNNSSQASNGMQVNQKIDNGTLRMYPSQSVKAPNEAAVTWSQGVKSDQHAANAHCNDGAGKLSDLLLMAVSASPIPNFNGNVHSEGGNDTLNHASSATDEMQGHLNNESQDCTMPNATKKSRNDGKPISSPAQAVVTPREADILRGRGGITNRHVGNMRFRDEARKLRAAYRDNGVSRKDKYLYSKVLVEKVRDYGGRFLEKGTDGLWHEMNEKSARKKASQVLREGNWD